MALGSFLKFLIVLRWSASLFHIVFVIFTSTLSFGLGGVNSVVCLEKVVIFCLTVCFSHVCHSDGRQGGEHQASFPKISTCSGRISKCVHM